MELAEEMRRENRELRAFMVDDGMYAAKTVDEVARGDEYEVIDRNPVVEAMARFVRRHPEWTLDLAMEKFREELESYSGDIDRFDEQSAKRHTVESTLSDAQLIQRLADARDEAIRRGGEAARERRLLVKKGTTGALLGIEPCPDHEYGGCDKCTPITVDKGLELIAEARERRAPSARAEETL